MINRVKIEVLDSVYTIVTPEEESYVQKLAKELDGQLRQLMEQNSRLTPAAALILCAIANADACKKSEESADNMRSQITEYLEEANRARSELDDARRELAMLQCKLDSLRK